MNATDLDRRRQAGAAGSSGAPAAAPSQGHSELAFIQIAFAGHNRSEDLGDPRRASAGLKVMFDLVRKAGIRRARLVSGLAPGADLLAAKAWKAADLGPIHGVFPFLDDTLEPEIERLVESRTWLDGRTTKSIGRNPYLAQTRWLIGAADLLIVVWTGEHARGAGGTADAVRLALEHGIPVLWLKPGAAKSLQLIRPEHLDEDFGFLEFLEELRFGREPLVRPATSENLRETLVEMGFGVRDADSSELDETPPISVSPIARTYAVFRRALGGKAPPFAMRPVPPDLAEQFGFKRLTQAQANADAAANSLGALHRSHQVILLGVAILAAAAGSASALWPDTKLLMVAIELALALGALAVWLDSERGNRHHRWAELRRLAEDLRLERVAWVLGLSTAPQGGRLRHSHANRRLRRQVGLPHAAYDPARVAEWGAWAVDELIAGQAAYHRGQALINGRVSHRVHQVENASGGLLMVILGTYLAASLALTFYGMDEPRWFDGLVALAGAIVPSIGAAGLALEATLALSEEAQRSRILAARLEALTADLGEHPALEAFQAAAKAAIRLQRAQEDHWTEGTVRRRLFRGG